ncbi:MAG: hypothetical protein ACP5R5_12845 [Armatimonadota bacterium]
MTSPAAWQIWLAALVTLGIYSYLWNDNRLYRLLLNVMIGLGVGYSFIVIWKNVLGPLWWQPMTRGFAAVARGFAPGSAGALWVLVGLLGTLWYFQFSRKYLWLSRIVIGMTLGAGAGMTFKQQFLLNAPQITDSFRPLIARADGSPLLGGSQAPVSLWMSVNNIVFVGTIVCVMVYFLFSFEHKTALVRGSAKAGRWLLMISFGAFFGNTVMTRMAVFLERLQFLVGDWSPIVPGWLWVTAGLVAVLGVWAARRQARRSSGKQEAADE